MHIMTLAVSEDARRQGLAEALLLLGFKHAYQSRIRTSTLEVKANNIAAINLYDKYKFYKDPSDYESNFMPYAKETDYFIAGHFYGDGAPYLFTREDAKNPDFRINLVADISCDIDGPVASTIRPSTIADPFYGYNPQTEEEVAFDADGAITVMAVDNLPCELPKDASEGFGETFLTHVIPAFFNNDEDGILERAKMTEAGELTKRYDYLQDYVDGNE